MTVGRLQPALKGLAYAAARESSLKGAKPVSKKVVVLLFPAHSTPRRLIRVVPMYIGMRERSCKNRIDLFWKRHLADRPCAQLTRSR